MTTLEMAPHTSGAPAQNWARVAADLWSGSTPDRFLGTIELSGTRFLAYDDYAILIGSFESLREAKAAVADPHGRSYERRRAAVVKRYADETRLTRLTAVIAALSIVGAVAGLLWGVTP